MQVMWEGIQEYEIIRKSHKSALLRETFFAREEKGNDETVES
jgi:hypothetical protein